VPAHGENRAQLVELLPRRTGIHSPADITSLVNQTLSLVRVSLRRDEIELTVDIAPHLPSIRCRSQQVQQVLLNLLTNARDALNERFPDGAPEKVIEISVKSFKEEGIQWVRLSVADHGNGIPAEDAEQVFDPFFTTKTKDKGTGMGLAISYGIVSDHKGNLWFETEEGVGTRFHVDMKVNNGWSLDTQLGVVDDDSSPKE